MRPIKSDMLKIKSLNETKNKIIRNSQSTSVLSSTHENISIDWKILFSTRFCSKLHLYEGTTKGRNATGSCQSCDAHHHRCNIMTFIRCEGILTRSHTWIQRVHRDLGRLGSMSRKYRVTLWCNLSRLFDVRGNGSFGQFTRQRWAIKCATNRIYLRVFPGINYIPVVVDPRVRWTRRVLSSVVTERVDISATKSVLNESHRRPFSRLAGLREDLLSLDPLPASCGSQIKQLSYLVTHEWPIISH